MALSIKNAKADRLARQLARRTGETLTEALTRALEERLERIRSAEVKELNAIAKRCAARLAVDNRTAEEILGYDENRLPT